MENRFLNCCFDYTLVGFCSKCDRLSCEGNHDPVFDLYYQRTNNEYCYCLNRNQLGQYWQCVVKDTFCPSHCDSCTVCKEMSDIYVELNDAYFFSPNTNVESKPYQPVLWLVFTSIIDKNRRQFYNEIAKSVPSDNLILNYGKTC